MSIRTLLGVEVLRSKRRSLSLSVDPSQKAVLRVPTRVSNAEIDAFLLKSQNWLAQQRKKFQGTFHPFNVKLTEGALIPLWGKKHQVLRSNGKKQLVVSEGVIELQLPSNLSVEQERKAFEGLLKKQVLPVFAQMYQHCWQQFSHASGPPPTMSVRAMRSRWGSYTSKQRISLNLHLAYYPKACLQNVIFHEFCHIRYHGHGKRFYQLLQKNMPDWKAADDILKAV